MLPDRFSTGREGHLRVCDNQEVDDQEVVTTGVKALPGNIAAARSGCGSAGV